MTIRPPLKNKSGISIAQLRKWLEGFPDDGEVWVESGECLTSPCSSAYELGDGSVSFHWIWDEDEAIDVGFSVAEKERLALTHNNQEDETDGKEG